MYLFGASGHAKVIIDILKSNQVEVLGLFDDYSSASKQNNLPILGGTKDHNEKYNPCMIAIGDNKARKRISVRLVYANYVSAFHRNAVIAHPQDINSGTVVMAGAVINSSVKIGKHCIINTSASVDHDCIIDDFVHIAPNATLCGGIEVREGALIGAGATITPNKKIGLWAVIGAGTVIIEDVPDYAVVVGNPGRVVKIQEQ